MKQFALFALFVLGTTTASFSNEPPTIDGSYVTFHAFEYSYQTERWYEMDTAFQMLNISIANGTVQLGNNTYTIIKMKKKYNKKMDALDYELSLEDANGVRSTAIFVFYEEEESQEKSYAQFYLSNSEMEVSFDLHN